jgi:CheY-like chemotaxis protein
MKRILIVDDEPHVVRVLKICLEREGYDVQFALEGNQALKLMRISAPDVLITDIYMQGMGGRELCETLAREFPERTLLTLVMTSMTALDARSWVKALSNTELLEKPLSPRILVARLRRFFASIANAQEVHHA